MFYATCTDMEASDIFHGAVVTVARRLRIFQTFKQPTAVPSHSSLRQRWHQWAAQETCKRLAYSIFMTDVHHATLFGHDRSVYELQLTSLCFFTADGWPQYRSSPFALT